MKMKNNKKIKNEPTRNRIENERSLLIEAAGRFGMMLHSVAMATGCFVNATQNPHYQRDAHTYTYTHTQRRFHQKLDERRPLLLPSLSIGSRPCSFRTVHICHSAPSDFLEFPADCLTGQFQVNFFFFFCFSGRWLQGK